MVAHNESGQRVFTAEELPKVKMKALEMRRRGLSYPRIAEALGVSLTTAYKYVDYELTRLAAERRMEGEKVLEIELSRLDRLTAKAMELAVKGSVPHMEIVLKMMDRRAKLLGLNAPTKHEVTVGEQRNLPDAALYERTQKLLLRLQAAGHDVGHRLLELNPFNAIPGEVVETVHDAEAIRVKALAQSESMIVSHNDINVDITQQSSLDCAEGGESVSKELPTTHD